MHRGNTLQASGIRALRFASVAVAASVGMTLGGCQSYERRPIDLAAHQQAFIARTPETPEVGKLAAELAARGPEAGGFDPADGVSCAEAEVIAVVFNAELRLARLRAGVTRAVAENAGLWEDPTIGVDLARILDSTPEPWKVFSAVGITIPISGRLEIEKQLAGVEHAAELARVAQREWEVRMSVRRGWSEWSALDAQLEATRGFVSRVEEVLLVVDTMERAGEMSRTEARLFRIERASKAAELADLESRTREADLHLRALMGMSPDAALRMQAHGIGPDRRDAEEARANDWNAHELARRNAAMLVAAAEYEAAEKTLELEIRKQYPDLHIGPGYGREDGQDQVLLGLSLPIPVLNANRQKIAEAAAKRDVARAGVETTLEQVVAGIRAAEVRLAAASRRRQLIETEIVPMVDALYADARQVAALGELNSLVLLESLSRQQEAKISLIEARRDEALAAVEVDELVGMPPHVEPPEAVRRPLSSSDAKENNTDAGAASRR